MYKEEPKKCQEVPKRNKSAKRYQKLPLSTKKNQGEPKVRLSIEEVPKTTKKK